MRAVVIRDPGPNSRLETVEIPDPEAGPGEVLVRVGACGVNNADLLARRGFFGERPPIPGINVAGTIVTLASGVTAPSAGTRVVLNPAITCGRCDHCRAGDHGTCRSRRALGQAIDGGYAEYVVIPIDNVHPIADSVSFEQAAAIPSNFFTAWQMLFGRARLQAGETVVVTGAAGGVGSAAVQIARLAGARVIGGVGRADKVAVVTGWGADVVIDYGSDNFAARVLEETDGKGAEIVLDIVGASMWPDCIRALRAGGRMVSCSTTGGNRAEFDIVDLLSKQISIIGAGGSGAKAVAARVVSLFNQGRLRAHIDRVLDLSDAQLAHDAITAREVVGKIVLKP